MLFFQLKKQHFYKLRNYIHLFVFYVLVSQLLLPFDAQKHANREPKCTSRQSHSLRSLFWSDTLSKLHLWNPKLVKLLFTYRLNSFISSVCIWGLHHAQMGKRKITKTSQNRRPNSAPTIYADKQASFVPSIILIINKDKSRKL